MSSETTQSIGNRTRRRKPARSKPARVRAAEPTPIAVRPAPEREADLEAQRALLADPATIAGTAGSGQKSRVGNERRDIGRAKTRTPASPKVEQRAAKPGPPAPNNRTVLLDATRAKRLAREARLREQDSKEALARARQTYEPPATPVPERPRTPARAETPSWQRVPLAPAPAPASERALAAELREARATLAIARETTKVQRDEINRLRGELVASSAALSARPAVANRTSQPFESPSEIVRLRERLATIESDRERGELERTRLLQSLAANEEKIAERGRRLEALHERFEVQAQALDQARRQSDRERRRHTEAQVLLERLRAALREAEGEEAIDASGAAAPAPASARETDITSTPVVEVVHAHSVLNTPDATKSSKARPPIFEVWRSEQIRRNFGPLGIDTIADLLSAPLERRAQAGRAQLPILLVGNGAATVARSLAEDLLRIGAPAFVLHVADPIAHANRARRDEDPLRDTLQICPTPESPEALGFLLRTLAPAVLISRDFLTWQRDAELWLGELAAASAAGTCLLFLEETGHGAVTPTSELAAVGERIWELLPERYTREAESGAPVGSFREAFARRAAAPRNELLRRLRQHFELELCAQFGFLAEAFVSGPIAACFDAGAARDQRFLKQIADLDERRLESGSASALHLIARVDPIAAR